MAAHLIRVGLLFLAAEFCTFAVVRAGEIEPEAADAIRRANETQIFDLQRWSVMSGEGHVELIDPHGKQEWSRRLRFETAGLEMVAMFDQTQGMRNGRVRISNPLTVTVADGKMTNGFRRAQNDNRHDAFASVSEGCRIDPRWVILPPVLRTPNELPIIQEQAKTVRQNGSAAGTVQVDLEYPDRVLRYWFAPDLDYRIVRFELIAGGRVSWVYEYEWQLVDGEVSPNIVILQVPDFQTWQGMFTHRLNLTSVRPVSRLAD